MNVANKNLLAIYIYWEFKTVSKFAVFLLIYSGQNNTIYVHCKYLTLIYSCVVVDYKLFHFRFALIQTTWLENASERPSFATIVTTLSQGK